LIVSSFSIGAQVGKGTGFISFYREVEAIFKAKIENVAVVRAAYFLENLLQDLPTVASQGVVYSPLGDFTKKFGYVATADIAKKIASYFLSENWFGHITVETAMLI
jgi:uncharacterized protein YbjT (DUF2867 family)